MYMKKRKNFQKEKSSIDFFTIINLCVSFLRKAGEYTSTLRKWITLKLIVFIGRIRILLTSLLLIVLFSLLLCSFFFLWGRKVAPYYESSFLTEIYRQLQGSHILRSTLQALRDWELYHALVSMLQEIDGKLEPIAYLLGLLGLISIFLSALNETLSTRSYGIVLREVVAYYFPCHLWVELIIYICFSLLGIIACFAKVGIAAGLCLVGLCICFSYTLIMACSLLFIPAIKKQLVLGYMETIFHAQFHTKLYIFLESRFTTEKKDILSKFLFHKSSKVKWQNKAGACVLDLAHYVGQQHTQRGGSLFGREDNLERYLINDIWHWLLPESFSLPYKSKNPTSISTAFKKEFPRLDFCQGNPAFYILYTKCIPYAEDKAVQNFQRNTALCSQVWSRLMDGVEDKNQQWLLAYRILLEAHCKDNWLFVTMCGGFLLWMGLTNLPGTDEDEKEMLNKCTNALLQIYQSYTEDFQKNQNLCFKEGWCELVYMSAAILQWKDVYLRTNYKNVVDAQNTFKHILYTVLPEETLGRLQEQLDLYLVYGLILYTTKNQDAFCTLPIYALQKLYPSIRSGLQLTEKNIYTI